MNVPRTIVITGTGRGLGRALAEAFAEDGHRVIGCSRSAASVEKNAAALGAPHWFTQVDVTDAEQVAEWARQVIEQAGPPDLLLNNAALINRNAALWEVPVEEFSEVVDTNVKGIFHVLRVFVPAMIERGTGVIVNFSSEWGRTVSPEVAPYCATKFAVEGLTQALAHELPRGLAAVPLNPGVIHTDMLESCFGGNAASFPSPRVWARDALPFLLKLSAADNGKPLSVA